MLSVNNLRYIGTYCEPNGYCDHVFALPSMGIKLYLTDWQKIFRILHKIGVREIYGIDIVQEDDIIPFDDDYKIIDYGRTLRVIAIKLDGIRNKPEYFIIKTSPNN